MATGRWKRWWRSGWTGSAIVMLSAAVLTLGWISESAAQGSQTWEFRGFFSSSSGVSPVPAPFARQVPVLSDGTFRLLCPQGGTFEGQMTGTTVTVSGCNANLRTPGVLNAAFPGAVRFGDLEIVLGDGSIVTVAGRRLSGPGHGDGLSGAARLVDVAVLTTSVQNRNIGLRLNSLRSGVGGGVTLSDLSLLVNGESVPVGSVLTGLLSGGGASADRTMGFGRLGIFVNGQGSFGDRDTTERTQGYNFFTAGLTVGADYRFTDQIIFGAAFHYLRTKIDVADRAADSTVNGYSLSAYGTYYVKDKFYVDGILTYGRNDYAIERQALDLQETRTDTITARTDGNQLSASAGGGYNFAVGGLTAGPTGRVTYTRVHIDGFTERGPLGSAAVRIQDQTVESLTTAFGAQATYAISTRWGVLLPMVRAEWEHEFKGNSRIVSATPVSLPGLLLTAQTDAPDRDYFNLGVGVSATFKRGVAAFVHFEESLGRSSFTNHSFTGGIRFEF
jgi:outer membrane lipase/esterase